MITTKVFGGIIVALGLALAATSTTLYFTKRNLDATRVERDNALDAIVIQKQQAQAQLDTLTLQVNDANRKLAEALALQETQDEQAKKRVRSLELQLAAAGRLRDPNANGCGPSGGSPAPGVPQAQQGGAGDAAQTGGVLSAELSELLRRLWREADEVNIAYNSCRSLTVPQ